MAEPILKWAGGKRSLIPHIISLFPSDYKKRSYHEPFVGGGATIFALKPQSGSMSDINTRLINFYRVVRDNPEGLIIQASKYSYDEKTYYRLRDRFNMPNISDLESASLLLFLNKTAYNGLYRVNSKGEFNVPFGRYKNPKIVSARKIRSLSRILKNIEIFNQDFAYVLDQASKGDLCYLDPPYQPVSETANFTSYSSEGFNMMEQKRLRDVCVRLDEIGVLFVLSNSHADEIQRLYNEIVRFRVETVQAKRAISSKASTRGPVNEILVTNIPRE